MKYIGRWLISLTEVKGGQKEKDLKYAEINNCSKAPSGADLGNIIGGPHAPEWLGASHAHLWLTTPRLWLRCKIIREKLIKSIGENQEEESASAPLILYTIKPDHSVTHRFSLASQRISWLLKEVDLQYLVWLVSENHLGLAYNYDKIKIIITVSVCLLIRTNSWLRELSEGDYCE